MKAITIVGVAALTLSSLACAGMEEDVGHVRQEWERVKYSVAPKQQAAEFEKLSTIAQGIMEKYPKRAEPAIWHGIVEASHAGAKGGIGALSLAKNARKSLEHALEIDPAALDGSAYTSLGSLYYQVPGWPIGFGDRAKAQELLKHGLALNPAWDRPELLLWRLSVPLGRLPGRGAGPAQGIAGAATRRARDR